LSKDFCHTVSKIIDGIFKLLIINIDIEGVGENTLLWFFWLSFIEISGFAAKMGMDNTARFVHPSSYVGIG
jgi:hypothetical protein